ncbi:MAG: FAD binding domain-containing protein [Rhodospirillales bacterium]
MGAYVRPSTLADAVSAIGSEDYVILAGGTDFYPARVGKPVRENVLDLSGLTELRGISDQGDHWRIGATTTWTDIVRADLPACFDGLKQAAVEVGGVQIQNAGTICGNICNASPAADGMPPLLTLDATVELADRTGLSKIALPDFVLGNRRTARRPDQLVTGLLIPRVSSSARSAFYKLGARKYLVISIVMATAIIEADQQGRVSAARIAVGACSEVARRLPLLEADLKGRQIGGRLSTVLAPDHFQNLSPIDDVRGSAGYRLEAAIEAVRRVLDAIEEKA